MLSGHRELLPRPVQQPERLSGEEGRRSDLGGMRESRLYSFSWKLLYRLTSADSVIVRTLFRVSYRIS